MTAFNSVAISDLVEHPTIKSLFPRQEPHIDLIARKIKEEKYREDKPIIINKAYEIIDGYVRTEACRRSGIEKIPAIVWDISDEKKMVEVALAEQRERRNLSDGDILQCVKVFIDKNWFGVRQPKEGDKHAYVPAAEAIGCKVNKIQYAISVAKNASEDLYKKVLSGEFTLHQAYGEVKEGKKGKIDPSIANKHLISLASKLIDKAKKFMVSTSSVNHQEVLKNLQIAIKKDEVKVFNASLPEEIYKGDHEELKDCKWYLVGTIK